MPYTAQSLGYYIDLLAAEYGKQQAMTYYHRFRCTTFTYFQLHELAHRCAAYFLGEGLNKGDRVLIYGGNCPEWVVTLFGCALTGLILVPIDAKSPPEFAAKIREETGARLVVSDVAVGGEDFTFKRIGLDELFSTIEGVDPEIVAERNIMVTGDDILEIVYTSGTTAAPKGAVIRHRNLVSNIWAARQRLVLEEGFRFLSLLPLSHVFEQNVGCMSVLRCGGHVVYTKQVRFARVLEIMRKERITHMIAVPAVLKNFQRRVLETAEEEGRGDALQRLLRVGGRLPFWLRRVFSFPVRRKLGSHLQAFVCGGAPLGLDTEAFWEDLGIKVVQGYGLTETCAMSCGNTFYQRKKGSVGHPLPKQQVCLDENGEILLSGENVITEYYNAPELNEEYFRDGWYRTGDIGRFDKEGDLFIVGRLKEMILTANGLNVFPSDIEEALGRLAEVEECAVFEDPTREGHLIAGVIPKGDVFDGEAARVWANGQLGPHQQLSKVFRWHESQFPKTTSLKLKRRELPTIYLERCGGQANEKRETDDPLLSVVAEVAGVEAGALTPETVLTCDLGLDSLKLVDLMIRLEAQFRTEIDEAKLCGKVTIEALRGMVESGRKVIKPRPISWGYWSWPAKWCRGIIGWIVEHVLLRRWIHLEVEGDVKVVLGDGPVIFVANHTSHLDALSIRASLPREYKKKLVIAAAADFFFEGKEKRSALMHPLVVPIFPFHRDGHFSENLKNVGEFFRRGHRLLIFPEGTRSRNGVMASFRAGIGMIVKEMQAQVVPVGIQGAFELWPASEARPKRGVVKLRFGEVMRFGREESVEEITKRLEEEVRRLKGDGEDKEERDLAVACP